MFGGEIGSPREHLQVRGHEEETEKKWTDGQKGNQESHIKAKGRSVFRERETNRNKRRDLGFVSLPSLRILAEQSQWDGLGRTRISAEHSVGEGKTGTAVRADLNLKRLDIETT